MDKIKRLTVVVALLSVFCGVCFAGETVTLNKVVYELFKPSKGTPYAHVVESRHSKDTPFSLAIPSEIKLEGISYEVREINAEAFKGSAIEKIVIPGTIQWIRDFAFYGCSNLKEVVLEAGDTKIQIHYGAFSNTQIEYVSLDRDIFYSYNIFVSTDPYWDYKEPESIFGTNIREVEIGSSVKVLPPCFAKCTLLKELSIPGTLIELLGFYDCTSLKKVIFEAGENPLTVYDGAFSHSGIQQVIINRNVSAGKPVFDYTELSKVDIGPEVTYIESCFFQGCYYLRSIKIPGTVKIIGWSTFGNCENLSEVILEEGLTNIWGAFSGCNSLESITLPDGLQNITGAFANCKNLKWVKLPSSLEVIGNLTFKDCINLEPFTLPPNLREIGENAFDNCQKWTSISMKLF